MVPPGWRRDHWNVLIDATSERWIETDIKLSSSQHEHLSATAERWISGPEDAWYTSKEICSIALFCRDSSAPEDRVMQLVRCSTAMHQRSLRESLSAAALVLPARLSLRRWEFAAYVKKLRAWLFGVRLAGLAPLKNLSHHVALNMGKWGAAAALAAASIWLLVPHPKPEFFAFIASGAGLGGSLGAVLGVGQFWYAALMTTPRLTFPKRKFWILFIAITIFHGLLFALIANLKNPSFVELLRVKLSELSYQVGPFILIGLLATFFLWLIRESLLEACNTSVSASSRVASATGAVFATGIVVVLISLPMAFGRMISSDSFRQVLSGVAYVVIPVAILGSLLQCLFWAHERWIMINEIRSAGIIIRVKGFSAKLFLAAAFSVICASLIIIFVNQYLFGSPNATSVLVLFFVMLGVSLLSFLFFVTESVLLYVYLKRVGTQYRLPLPSQSDQD